ncbi:hypothetical protein DUW12_08645 [Salmonella enterica subsp. enterica serovar Duisburg]|nr:hypothetical protein [Salmonella enterica]EBW4304673.1 hypothetical protein [Salmonella enterica subsp. enterica serovar Duisburg]EBW6904044.1 hypothetical protein [Salmonella enterica subsp. enterica serovar Duisburg]EBY1413199.1 hypothetical protein [Salmonella enterica subsp. enterica serovar Duisburg]EBY6672176.1 hypothetical protein [Salmonella enterica subsp. enterica serovar Duisburg]
MRVRRDTFIQIIPKLTVYLSINLSSFYGILEIFFNESSTAAGNFHYTATFTRTDIFDRRKDAGVNT